MIKTLRIYTDGSYSGKLPNEVHGGVVWWDMEKDCAENSAHLVSNLKWLTRSNNIGGECLAAYVGIRSIVLDMQTNPELYKDNKIILEVVYDYKGIGAWPTLEWPNRNTPVSIWYYNAISSILKENHNLEIKWIWGKGHSGDRGNTLADSVASFEMSYCRFNNIPVFNFDGEDGKLKI